MPGHGCGLYGAATAMQRLLEGIHVSPVPARKMDMQHLARLFDTLLAAGWQCV